jgi:type II secretory pathway pseudopilin PulG
MSRRRPGKSLVELMVILAIMAVVLAISATSLTTLFRLGRQLSRDIEQGAALNRLASRWRSDAHEAKSVTIDSDCAFSLADGRTIHYAFAAPRIVREVRRDATVLHRDRFLLSTAAGAAFERDTVGSRSLVRLAIRPVEVHTRRTEMPRRATLEAAVGLNVALAHQGESP